MPASVTSSDDDEASEATASMEPVRGSTDPDWQTETSIVEIDQLQNHGEFQLPSFPARTTADGLRQASDRRIFSSSKRQATILLL